MDDRTCAECGQPTGPDGWCPDCSGGLVADRWDDTGGDPDPDLTLAASDYDMETPIGQRLMDGEDG